MSQKEIQLDTPFSGSVFGVLPKEVPGRVLTDDFVFFNYPSHVKPGDYVVVIPSLDTSGLEKYRQIGPLNQTVELPHVFHDAYAEIYVMPRINGNLPTFYSRLSKGSTYSIPDVSRKHQKGMRHQMTRHGVLTSGA